jgi:hypothetical protein
VKIATRKDAHGELGSRTGEKKKGKGGIGILALIKTLESRQERQHNRISRIILLSDMRKHVGESFEKKSGKAK